TTSYTAAFASANVGAWSVSVSGIAISGGDAGNYTYNTTAVTTASITAAPATSTATVSPVSLQYSDRVSFTATICPGSALTINPTGSSVTFKIGSQTMGTVSTWTAVVAPTCSTGSGIQATLANVALLEPTPFGTAPTGQLAPGTRTVTALLSGIDSNFSTANSPTTTLTINKEDAKA